MKTKFTLLVTLFLSLNSLAQEIPMDIIDRINATDNIFEGFVIRADPYWTADHKFIYTSSTIEITKIFKGTLQCGTVEVITDGGAIDDTVLTISHDLVLKKGMIGIFLANDARREQAATDFYLESNVMTLDFPLGTEGFIRYFDDLVNRKVIDWQFSYDSLQQVYDLMNSLNLTMTDCYAGRSAFDLRREFFSKSDAWKNHNIGTPAEIEKYSEAFRVTSQDTNITYEFLNQAVTTNGAQKFFEFDLYLSSSHPVYYRGGTQIFKYDSLSFGTLIHNSGGLTITRLAVMSDILYGFVVSDNVAPGHHNEFHISIGPNPSAQNHQWYALYPIPVPTLHFSILIQDCNHNGDVHIISDTLLTRSYYTMQQTYVGTSNPFSRFDSTFYAGPSNFYGCDFRIDSVRPRQVNGGTGDTVTVYGKSFGASRGTGNIFLRDANDGSSYLPLDSIDFHTWNDSVVQFIMPGNVDNIIDFEYGEPGTGRVRLANSSGQAMFGDSVKVWYSIHEFIENDSVYKKKMFNLVDPNAQQSGGYTFRTDSTTSSSVHPERWNCIDVAIKEWVCLSRVHFVLGTDSIAQGDSVSWDDVNRIQFGGTHSSTALAETKQWGRVGFCGRVIVKDIDIVVNKNYINSFFYSTNCADTLPPNKVDFLAVIIHELGHAHSLNHVCDVSKIMYYLMMTHSYAVMPYNRRIYLDSDLSAMDGSGYVIQKAQDSVLAGCTFMMQVLSPGTASCDSLPERVSSLCVEVGINEIAAEVSDLTAYPNPSSETVNIAFGSEKSRNSSVIVYDALGQKMIEQKIRTLSGKNVISLDVSRLAAGIYYVGVSSSVGNKYLKMLKQ